MDYNVLTDVAMITVKTKDNKRYVNITVVEFDRLDQIHGSILGVSHWLETECGLVCNPAIDTEYGYAYDIVDEEKYTWFILRKT